jgi:alpha-1,3-rhamnosyltransferase
MISSEKSEILVSIVVITYNSARYVIETLESAKNQTYRSLELIITDDASTDDTVNVCRNWLEQNSSGFVRTEILTVEKNTGIPANCNRGVKAAKGEWIKLIAGDDVLCPEIISDYILYISENEECNVLYSDVKFITDKGIEPTNIDMKALRMNLSGLGAAEQFQILLRTNPVWAATLMYSKEIAQNIEYDEKFRYYEDRPFLQKITLRGYKIYYVDIVGALYRKHNESIQLVSKQFLQTRTAIDSYSAKLEVIKYIDNPMEKYLYYTKSKYCINFYKYITNKRNCFTKLLFYAPLFVIDKLIRVFTNNTQTI